MSTDERPNQWYLDILEAREQKAIKQILRAQMWQRWTPRVFWIVLAIILSIAILK